MSLLAVVLANVLPTAQGASSFLLPVGAPFTEPPRPPALITFVRGPHPVCESIKSRSPVGDACALHAHLSVAPMNPKRLQSTARRVLKTLGGAQQSLLRARLLAIKAQRTKPCLQQAGSGLFAAMESQMILGRQREALQSYTDALRGMNRTDAAPILDEIAALVRRPYEVLAKQMPPQITADYEGEINLLPGRIISSLRLLARSVGHTLPEQATRPIHLQAKRRANKERATLWLEGDELLIRSPGSLEPLRLRGDEAIEALRARLKTDHPSVVAAAKIAGVMGFSQLRQQLVFLSQLDDPLLSNAGWIGRLGLADAEDHDALVKWLLLARPGLDSDLIRALRRFSDLAGNRIRQILPSRWPVPILRAMIAHSQRFDQRVWYTALLEHKDTTIKVLAHAAMRKTKPEDWLTSKLRRHDACSADHLRLLMPERKATRQATRTSQRNTNQASPSQAQDEPLEGLAEGEEIDDSAGSVQIPDEDD